MLAAVALAMAAGATVIVPAVASVTVVQSGLGPFRTPFESARETADVTAFLSAGFEVNGCSLRWSGPTRRSRT